MRMKCKSVFFPAPPPRQTDLLKKNPKQHIIKNKFPEKWFLTGMWSVAPSCVVSSLTSLQRATRWCCKPSIRSSLSMAAWLLLPPVAVVLSHWGWYWCLAPRAHPPQQYNRCYFLLPDVYSIIATFIPACFLYSLSHADCSVSSRAGFVVVAFASLCTWHHCSELPLNKSVWTWLFPFGTSYA